jgi:hypothetical protein
MGAELLIHYNQAIELERNTLINIAKKNEEIEISEPRMAKSHDVKLDAEYAEWIAEVKHRYRSAQVKAAVKENGEKQLFNWQGGIDIGRSDDVWQGTRHQRQIRKLPHGLFRHEPSGG